VKLVARPLLAVALCAAACSGPTFPPDAPVVLISIDTLRSDRLPVYGYARGATPAIDRLAADGVLFERAYAHAPTTLPSHASIFTGRLPPSHGVRDNAGYRLDDGVATLAERLQAAGYATGAAVSSFVLRRATGIARGFERYDDGIEFDSRAGLGGLERAGDETLSLALAWLDDSRRLDGRPPFLFLHLFEPHAPYTPPPPFDAAADPYDGEISAADRVVGRLIDALEERGLYDDALIVLLSDHGEGLGDHGEQEHGLLLYREALHVPLILKLPRERSRGARVAAPAQLVDVLPTLVDAVGAERPPGLDGDSLLDLLAGRLGERAIYAETFYPRLHFGWSELASLIEGRHHYIDGPDPELYDLATDPGERANVLAVDTETAARLAARLGQVDRELQTPSAVDAETRERLASLGYVGSTGTSSSSPTRADPKTRVDVVNQLRRAQALLATGDLAAAVTALQSLVAAEPGLVDAWDWLGRALERLGRTEDALAAYRDAIARVDGPSLLALRAATLYLRAGRLDEAAAHAELGRAADPAEATLILAQVAKRRGDLDRALVLARSAVAESDTRFGPQLTLADVLIARREWEEALAWIERVDEAYAARDRPDPALIRGLEFLRGQVYANLGEAERAEQAFRSEIEANPRDPQSYTHLAVLYTLMGRAPDAAAVLRELTAALPVPLAYAEAARTAGVLGDAATARELLREGRRRFPDSPALDAAERAL
jgi:arylsulfatase A-like enzyme/tetratricopeptide (TPR) repeat protein